MKNIFIIGMIMTTVWNASAQTKIPKPWETCDWVINLDHSLVNKQDLAELEGIIPILDSLKEVLDQITLIRERSGSDCFNDFWENQQDIYLSCLYGAKPLLYRVVPERILSKHYYCSDAVVYKNGKKLFSMVHYHYERIYLSPEDLLLFH